MPLNGYTACTLDPRRPVQRERSERSRRQEGGFTLIEILIALIILSIGLLGVAAMQIRSLQNSHSSFERSVATLQARDLAERMWAGICDLPTQRGNQGGSQGQNPNHPNHPVRRIEAAWRSDHIAAGTFTDQNWSATLVAPTAQIDAWTVTINWIGRPQGQPEQIVHYFRLPPPPNPDFCPDGD